MATVVNRCKHIEYDKQPLAAVIFLDLATQTLKWELCQICRRENANRLNTGVLDGTSYQSATRMDTNKTNNTVNNDTGRRR